MTKTRQEATAGPAALQPAGSARPDRPLQGIALMVAGVFLLSVMDTLTKVAVAELSTPVLIACRTAVVMLPATGIPARCAGRKRQSRTVCTAAASSALKPELSRMRTSATRPVGSTNNSTRTNPSSPRRRLASG